MSLDSETFSKLISSFEELPVKNGTRPYYDPVVTVFYKILFFNLL